MREISTLLPGALVDRPVSVDPITAEPKLRFHRRNSRQCRYQLEHHLHSRSQRLGKHLDLEA